MQAYAADRIVEMELEAHTGSAKAARLPVRERAADSLREHDGGRVRAVSRLSGPRD